MNAHKDNQMEMRYTERDLLVFMRYTLILFIILLESNVLCDCLSAMINIMPIMFLLDNFFLLASLEVVFSNFTCPFMLANFF